ncbi:unnamed protein product [Trichobilharzia szidati]|nr:unnamed protein product [Trichobilharzia szidati]
MSSNFVPQCIKYCMSDLISLLFLQSNLTSLQELESLKATLTEINTCLSIENDKLKYCELFNLKKDLEELITLKEDELLAYRKLQLLTEVDSIIAKNNNTTKDNEIESSSSQINTLTEHSLIGQRCSIPGWTSNGKFIRQNALILSIVDCDGEMPERVRVILSHPTRLSEIPCESFFETGSCYRGIRCPNSHGKIVNIEDIEDWFEPDAQKYLREGQPCLANDPNSPHNSLWRHARILQTDFESSTCVIQWGHSGIRSDKKSPVKRQSYDNLEAEVISLPLKCIHVLDDDEEEEEDTDSDVSVTSGVSMSTTDDSESEANDDLDSCLSTKFPMHSVYNKETTDDTTKSQSYPKTDSSSNSSSSKLHSRVQFSYGTTLKPSQLMDSSSSVISVEEESKINDDNNNNNKQHVLGEWEVHTRGIGSRLLASMGYPGYGGLGRCHQGRQFPVCTSLEKYQIHNAKWHYRPSLDNVVLPKRPKARRNASSLSLTQGKKGKVNTCEKNTTSKNEGSSHSGGSVFQLINLALLPSNRSSTCSSSSSSSTSDTSKPSNVSNSLKNTQISSITHCNESVLKRKLFHTHEQINKLHQQICKTQEAVKRNEGRDRIAMKQAQQKVVELQSQLIQLKENERTIVNMQNKQMKEKKLRIF